MKKMKIVFITHLEMLWHLLLRCQRNLSFVLLMYGCMVYVSLHYKGRERHADLLAKTRTETLGKRPRDEEKENEGEECREKREKEQGAGHGGEGRGGAGRETQRET